MKNRVVTNCYTAEMDKADMAVLVELRVEELRFDTGEAIISMYFCLCLLSISVTVTKVLNSGFKKIRKVSVIKVILKRASESTTLNFQRIE